MGAKENQSDHQQEQESLGEGAHGTDISDAQLKKYQPGQRDETGCEIKDVYVATKKFILYDCGGKTRYVLPDDYETARKLRKKIAGLGGLRASIDDLRADPVISGAKRKPGLTPGLEENESRRAGRETAWALESALESEPDDGQDLSLAIAQAKEILEGVDTRLRSLIKSAHRKRYAFSNLGAFCAIAVVLGFAALVFWWSKWPIAERYAIYGVFGALGAFLSVITTIWKFDFDINIQGWENAFSGITRILIGVIGAFVIALALDCQLIDPTFGHNPTSGAAENHTEQDNKVTTQKPEAGAATASSANDGLNAPPKVDNIFAMYLIFAFIAGFSESLVPNILRRGEQAAGVADERPSDGPIVQSMKASTP